MILNSDVWVMAQSRARPSLFCETTACPGGVQRAAFSVHMWAKTFLGIMRARQVWLRSFRTNPAILFNPLVSRTFIATKAGAGGSTIEKVLDRRIDVDALSASRNFHAICEG